MAISALARLLARQAAAECLEEADSATSRETAANGDTATNIEQGSLLPDASNGAS